MNTRTGTDHFQTMKQAQRYYARQNESAQEALNEGRISIGAPLCKQGERVTCDSDGRYWIESPSIAEPTRFNVVQYRNGKWQIRLR